MKVLFILNTNKYAGAENVTIQIISQLRKRFAGFEGIYVSLDGEIKEYMMENHIHFEPVKKVNVKEIKRVIKKIAPDIIHANDFRASVFAAVCTRRIPIISHIHNNEPWIKKININSIIYGLSTIRYRSVLTVSPSICDEFIFGFAIKKKVRCIGNPIDIKEIRVRGAEESIEKTYDLIFLGRISRQKKPLLFIEIVNAIVKGGNRIRAILVGSGELEDECRNRIRELELENEIEMTGFVKDPYKYLRQSRIMVMPSEWEGYGLAAVEALAFELPVVASPVGGLPKIVNDNCGKLCREKGEYVEEIIKLLNDLEYYSEKSHGAGKRADEMDNIDLYMSIIFEQYNELIS